MTNIQINTATQQDSDLSELYQEVIVDHARRPRFKQRPQHCQFCQEGKNPACGDHLTIYCEVSEGCAGIVLSASFEGTGCSISQASASIMCERLQNVTFSQAKEFIRHAENVYMGKTPVSDDLQEDIEALYGVSKFPVRVKCAALAWKTFEWLLSDHFDALGYPKQGCKNMENVDVNCTRKLKIVSTEGHS